MASASVGDHAPPRRPALRDRGEHVEQQLGALGVGTDNWLSANQAAGGGAVRGQGGGGQGPGVSFGEGLYYLAFFGEPSETEQFTVQFGGHHAAYNITYDGADVTLSPTLTGVEPTQFDFGGQSYNPLEDKRTSVIAALESLGESELADAEISGSYDDLLLGPGNDGPFPEPEGILVSGLTQDQQDKITSVVRAWVGDLDEDAAEALVAKYVSEYDKTYLAGAVGRRSTTPRPTCASTVRRSGSSSPTSPVPRPRASTSTRSSVTRPPTTAGTEHVRRLLPALLIAVLVLVGGPASAASAHPMSTSAVLLDVGDDRIEARCSCPSTASPSPWTVSSPPTASSAPTGRCCTATRLRTSPPQALTAGRR